METMTLEKTFWIHLRRMFEKMGKEKPDLLMLFYLIIEDLRRIGTFFKKKKSDVDTFGMKYLKGI